MNKFSFDFEIQAKDEEQALEIAQSFQRFTDTMTPEDIVNLSLVIEQDPNIVTLTKKWAVNPPPWVKAGFKFMGMSKNAPWQD